MNFENSDLKKHGIIVVNKLPQNEINEISKYVADTLFLKFPTLNFNYTALYENISNLPMYYAQMPEGLSAACYYYKDSSIYFCEGVEISELKKLAVHEIIHHFQEVKTPGGRLYKLGLSSFLGSKTFGNSINEAAVQFMAAYATNEERDVVTYYGIKLPTDSPNYYPIITNLIKQIAYLVGYGVLFESCFFADNKFYDSFKNLFGESNAYKIQEYFDKIKEKYKDRPAVYKLIEIVLTDIDLLSKSKKFSDTVEELAINEKDLEEIEKNSKKQVENLKIVEDFFQSEQNKREFGVVDELVYNFNFLIHASKIYELMEENSKGSKGLDLKTREEIKNYYLKNIANNEKMTEDAIRYNIVPESTYLLLITVVTSINEEEGKQFVNELEKTKLYKIIKELEK